MHPNRAVERYLNDRKPEVAESTYYNHKYTLDRFVEWCEDAELDDIADVDGFHIHDFKSHRRETGIAETTLRNNMVALRTFIRWLEAREVIADGTADRIQIPQPDDAARDTTLDPERAEQIIGYLQKFEYVSFRHILFELLWDTGLRIGAVRALDVDDFYPRGEPNPYLDVQHRPQSDTPLKNKENGERQVIIHQRVSDLLKEYIEVNRHDVEDDYGRRPLLTSQHGRPALSNIRQNINTVTRPCDYANHCPHDRQPDECEATEWAKAQNCPSSVYPHAIRRTVITEWLNRGHRAELLSDRMNVGVKTLEKHYDARTKSEKRKLRSKAFKSEFE